LRPGCAFGGYYPGSGGGFGGNGGGLSGSSTMRPSTEMIISSLVLEVTTFSERDTHLGKSFTSMLAISL